MWGGAKAVNSPDDRGMKRHIHINIRGVDPAAEHIMAIMSRPVNLEAHLPAISPLILPVVLCSWQD